MKWANFLHIYQPAGQQPSILEAVARQSYEPLLKGILADPRVRLTLNVNGSLLELFDAHGHTNLIDLLRRAGSSGQIEFTGSAKYHAFLPFLEAEEIARQITINDETNSYYLGAAYTPRGFFPPEMAYTPEIAGLIRLAGFEWVILDEIALTGHSEAVDWRKTYVIPEAGLRVFFRERRLSNLIMSSLVRSAESFSAAAGDVSADRYVVTGMDGETFGHHRPGLTEIFFEILRETPAELTTISDLLGSYPEVPASPVTSTWSSSPEDIERGAQFLSWADPSNDIHKKQRRLLRLAMEAVYAISSSAPAYQGARKKLDRALASDHFWWASAKPWWSAEMIELGAHLLLSTVRVASAPREVADEAAKLYEEIISTAFEWQRSGKIHAMMHEQKEILRIPFRERTLEAGGEQESVYRAFLELLREAETSSATKGEYEQAILWRDAIFKLEHKLDVYDAVNAIDLLRLHVPNEDLERRIERYKAEYRRIRGGQPEQRGS